MNKKNTFYVVGAVAVVWASYAIWKNNSNLRQNITKKTDRRVDEEICSPMTGQTKGCKNYNSGKFIIDGKEVQIYS